MTRKSLMFVTLVLVSFGLACGGSGTSGLTQRPVHRDRGGTGGVYYPYGGGLAKVISDRLEGVEATAEVTAGTVDNLKFVGNGFRRPRVRARRLAQTTRPPAAGVFAEFGAIPLRAIAVLYDNFNHVVTFEDTGIESLTALDGRVVSTGAPGSGTENQRVPHSGRRGDRPPRPRSAGRVWARPIRWMP